MMFFDFARFTNLAISLKTVIAITYDCIKVKLAVRAYLFAHTGPISLAFQMRKIDFEKFVYMHVYMLFINPFLYNLKLIFFFRFLIYLAFFMLNKIHAFRRICFLWRGFPHVIKIKCVILRVHLARKNRKGTTHFFTGRTKTRPYWRF